MHEESSEQFDWNGFGYMGLLGKRVKPIGQQSIERNQKWTNIANQTVALSCSQWQCKRYVWNETAKRTW